MITCRSLYIVLLCIITFIACREKKNYTGPGGYDFAKPETYILPERLNEISGISLLNGNTDTFYAVNDEEGKVFYFNLTDKEYPFYKFSKNADYEDLAIMNDKRIVVLKSDGSLYVFAANNAENKEVKTAEVFAQILPMGEYEGMAADGNKLLVLCKQCLADKKMKQVTVYEIVTMAGTIPKISTSHSVDISSIGKKQKFNPSCIAKNPITGEWYILSSANNRLMILDAAWILKETYELDASVFKQPEGMSFSNNGDLYISNEGGERKANIIKFSYKGS
jgi:uncharacterized protein YjiK